AGAAHRAEVLTLGNPLAYADRRARVHVAVPGDKTVPVVDGHGVAQPASVPPGEDHHPGVGRDDRRAEGIGDVETQVEVWVARIGRLHPEVGRPEVLRDGP